MKYKLTFFIILFAVSLITGCCSISIPTPQLTGEKTAIERQIIGDYKELEKDAWVISSVKTNIQRGEEVTPSAGSDLLLLKAIKTRELHQPRIRKYKNEGAIGEKNNGLIAYKSTPKYEQDKELKYILNTVIEEENRARKIIFERSLSGAGKEKPSDKEIEAFGRIFAEEQRALAQKNDWIQENSGRWVKK